MKQTLFFFTLLQVAAQVKSQEAQTLNPPVIKTRIINTDFFAPLTGNLSFGYEQPIANSITIEGNIGIIGVGVIKDNLRPAGIFIKGGPKIYFTPDYLMEGMKRYNDFQGTYFNPQIIYSGFGFDYSDYAYNNYNPTTTTRRGSNNSIAFILNLGKQWVLAKTISIDMYAGAGYGWSDVHAPLSSSTYYGYPAYDWNYEVPQKYSHAQVSNQAPIAFDAGFNIGLLIK